MAGGCCRWRCWETRDIARFTTNRSKTQYKEVEVNGSSLLLDYGLPNEGRCVAIEDESLWAFVHAGRSLRIVHVLGFFLYFLKDFDLFVNADGLVDPKTSLVN